MDEQMTLDGEYSMEAISIETPEMELYMEEGMEGIMPISTEIDPSAMAAVVGFGLMGFFIMLAVFVVMVVAWWKIFTKAKQPGWASIIPFYNLYIMLKIVKMSPLLMLILIGFLIPFVNLFVGIAWCVVMVIMWHRLSLAFGKGIGYTLGLLFLNPIFSLMLAFGDAQYTEPAGEGSGDAPQPPQQPQQSQPQQQQPKSQVDAEPMSAPDMD